MMKVIDRNGETITEYDLTAGRLVSVRLLRQDAVPIDNKTKFAWTDDDFEKAQMYVPDPVKSVKTQIAELKARLAQTDYKVIKCSECQLLGQEMPYDVAVLHSERQAIRDQINELEQEDT